MAAPTCFDITLLARSAHHVTRHNTPIYNILSPAPQLSIFQKALGTLPEDGNVMSKHVGATIHKFSLLIMYVSGVHHATRHNTPQHPQYSIDCSSIEHLSEGTRNAS